MTTRLRASVFAVAGAALGALLVTAVLGLPPVGHYRGPYGDVIDRAVVAERHVTDAVSAVNFDYRGFDTLGEEFILFASVLGVVLLLRRQADEWRTGGDHAEEEEGVPETSETVRVMMRGLLGPTLVFGVYVVVHGDLTPGGGFQGGVILATALLMIFLAGHFRTFHRIVSSRLVEVAEAAGAGGYVLLGLGPLAAGAAFLENVLPLGHAGDVLSGGTMPLISVTTGLEVGAGFTLLLIAFLEETLVLRLGAGR